jgi:hypothetical protein
MSIVTLHSVNHGNANSNFIKQHVFCLTK